MKSRPTTALWRFSCVQGINYLVKNKLLDERAETIAEFLYKEEGLNKTAIGEFLGERWDKSVKEGARGEKWATDCRCWSSQLTLWWLLCIIFPPQGGAPPPDPEGLCGAAWVLWPQPGPGPEVSPRDQNCDVFFPVFLWGLKRWPWSLTSIHQKYNP